MSFKDEYKEAFDSVVPDKKFLDELSEKMKKEEQKKWKGHRRPAAVAACVCLIFLAGFAIWHVRNILPEDAEPVQIHTGNTLPSSTEEPTIFETPKWYQESDSAEKIFSDFLKRLDDGGDLDVLYKNSENSFSDEMMLSDEEVHEMAEQIAGAEKEEKTVQELGEERTQNLGEAVYYMAEFKNGDIIKFTIRGDRYLIFQDLDYVYKY